MSSWIENSSWEARAFTTRYSVCKCSNWWHSVAWDMVHRPVSCLDVHQKNTMETINQVWQHRGLQITPLWIPQCSTASVFSMIFLESASTVGSFSSFYQSFCLFGFAKNITTPHRKCWWLMDEFVSCSYKTGISCFLSTRTDFTVIT